MVYCSGMDKMNLDLKAVKKCQELIAARKEILAARKELLAEVERGGSLGTGVVEDVKYLELMIDLFDAQDDVLRSLECYQSEI